MKAAILSSLRSPRLRKRKKQHYEHFPMAWGERKRELSAQRHQKKLKLQLPLQFDQVELVQGILLAM